MFNAAKNTYKTESLIETRGKSGPYILPVSGLIDTGEQDP